MSRSPTLECQIRSELPQLMGVTGSAIQDIVALEVRGRGRGRFRR